MRRVKNDGGRRRDRVKREGWMDGREKNEKGCWKEEEGCVKEGKVERER